MYHTISPFQRQNLSHVIDIQKGHLCDFYLDHDGVFVILANDEIITVEKVAQDHELIRAYLKQFGVRPPLFYNATNTQPLGKVVRKKLEFVLNDCFSALGVASESRVGVAVANIFIGLSKSQVPKRIFNSELDARQWLYQYL